MSPVIKHNRPRIQISDKQLMVVLSAACVALMVFTFRSTAFEGVVKTAIGRVVVPFQEGIAAAGGFISQKADEMASLRDVLAQNELLQEQVDQLTYENTLLSQERYELNTLRELYQLDQTYSEYEKTGARVIASDLSNWFSSFTIDKGEEDGIRVDCNVMAGSGLVGRVVSVGPNFAKVQSIISDSHNVSATVLATDENLIVSGNLATMQQDGVIDFQQLSDQEDLVSVGDKVVTSDISDKYLPGILVGYISSINTEPNNLTKSGTLTPAVDFSHLDEVLVVTELKQGTGD